MNDSMEGNSVDSRLLYYSRDEIALNFGDYLSDFLYRKMLLAPYFQVDFYHLIGSVIDNQLITWDFEKTTVEDAKIAFWCCGSRSDEPLRKAVYDRCLFFGVRGPLTRKVLGLSEETPLGDPGLLLPILFDKNKRKSAAAGKVICVPHISQMGEFSSPPTDAALVRSPCVHNDEELLMLINDIASADFVLAGSLHAAIIAAAYGTPFAFWDNDFIDIPFKWMDFAASINIEAHFVKNIDEGYFWYQSIREHIKIPSLAKILGCCPIAVRPSFILRAVSFDLGLGKQATRRFELALSGLEVEKNPFIEHMQFFENQRYIRTRQRHRSASKTRRELRQVKNQFRNSLSMFSQYIEKMSVREAEPESTIRFGAEDVGLSLLLDGWTTPEHGESFPWSVVRKAGVRLPLGSGWENAAEIIIEGYIFLPKLERINSRSLRVWMENKLVFYKELRNDSAEQSVLEDFSVKVPRQFRVLDKDLIIEFELDQIGSPHDLGLSEDMRELGIGLKRIEYLFYPENR
ncbi:polysaccharide pyruvyl transferase family protein [Oryzifoliimicrobium ureilyticus]|uniref:polysaccharide pyruvyl transferase family protein n=1 Tax=Oryzifoliimicrobium ureilyticus TaxID=3113724 RepID=UPI0030760714